MMKILIRILREMLRTTRNHEERKIMFIHKNSQLVNYLRGGENLASFVAKQEQSDRCNGKESRGEAKEEIQLQRNQRDTVA